jgi:hypothetical protein
MAGKPEAAGTTCLLTINVEDYLSDPLGLPVLQRVGTIDCLAFRAMFGQAFMLVFPS